MWVCGGQRSILSVSLNGSQTHFLETGSLSEPGANGFSSVGWPASSWDVPVFSSPAPTDRSTAGPVLLCEHWASELGSSNFHREHLTCRTVFPVTWTQVILGWEHHLQVQESSNMRYSVWVKKTELCPKGTWYAVIRKVFKEMKGSFIGTSICICCWGCLWVLYFCLKNSSVGNKIVVSFIYHRFWVASHSKIQKKTLLLCFSHWDIF